MTVPYLHHLSHSGFGFYRILCVWPGSLYKGIWRKFLVYCSLYTLISLLYRFYCCVYIFTILVCRFVLSQSEEVKQGFERWCVYEAKNEGSIPLEFILGFYVSQVSCK